MELLETVEMMKLFHVFLLHLATNMAAKNVDI